ncbi:MAG: SagB/ThcOx family dehydrogenase [Chitinispirillia bacterium]|jgi:SagB-type dehydrogenase family enzyme
MNTNEIDRYRYFLKDSNRKEINFKETDQNRGIPAPPLEKTFDRNSVLVDLISPDDFGSIPGIELKDAILRRKSNRIFTSEELTLQELSFLLWSTQGIKKIINNSTALRTVPSAGARHSFETYLFIINVKSIKKGLYRYLPIENQLLFIREVVKMESSLSDACFGQKFVGKGAVTFIWTTIPYRMEWRYSLSAHRVILIDIGHVCQNLYLACEAINAGTCAIGAYDQEAVDALIGVNGNDEFTVYLAPAGKV